MGSSPGYVLGLMPPKQVWSDRAPCPYSTRLNLGEAPTGSEPQFPYLSPSPTTMLQTVGDYEPVKEAQESA